jgi:hypothetical protein
VPALGNVGSVLFLFLFIWACIGMTLFGTVRPGVYLGDDANFRNIGRALLTLFRMMTGECWDGEWASVGGNAPKRGAGHVEPRAAGAQH